MKIHGLFALEPTIAKGKRYRKSLPYLVKTKKLWQKLNFGEGIRLTQKSEEERLHKEISDNSQITEGLMNRITSMDRNIQVMPKYIKSCDTSDEKNYAKMNNQSLAV